MGQIMKIKLPIIALLFMLATPIYAFAQWGFQMSVNQEYNNNPFHLPEEERSWVSSIFWGANREWQNLDLSYEGFYSDFAQIRERNFYWHSLSLNAGSDTTVFNLNVEQRIDKKEYNLYDYWSVGGNFSHRIFIKSSTFLLSGNIEANFFQEVPELDNEKFTATVGLNHGFRTKTTLIVRMGFEHKIYQNSQSQNFEESPFMTGMPATALAVTDGDGHGSSHGNHGSNRGYMDWENKGFMTHSIYGDFANESVSQFFSIIRIAQSVSPTMGLAVQYSGRRLIRGNDRYISGISDSYSRESEIFNDPMGYESDVVGAELTKVLPWAMRLKVSSYYSKRNFISQGIYSDAENYVEDILRKDESRFVRLMVTKDFYFTKFEMSLTGSFQWLRNESNSFWYDYSNHYAALGMEFYF